VPGIQAFFIMGPGFTMIPCAMLCIIGAGLFAPAICAIVGSRGLRVSSGLAGAALALMVVGWATNGYSPEKPKMSSLSYCVNLSTQKALWMSSDDVPDAYTKQFFKDTYTRGSIKDIVPGRNDVCLIAPAPVASIEPSRVEVIKDVTSGDRRMVSLRYTSAGRAEESHLVLLEPGEVFAASAEGFGDLRPGGVPWQIDIPVMPRTGVITLTLTVAVGQPLRLRVEEDAYRLLDVIPPGSTPRPKDHIPKPNTLDWWESKIRGTYSITSNHTLVTKEFTL
jgi:hypothetical protein